MENKRKRLREQDIYEVVKNPVYFTLLMIISFASASSDFRVKEPLFQSLYSSLSDNVRNSVLLHNFAFMILFYRPAGDLRLCRAFEVLR